LLLGVRSDDLKERRVLPTDVREAYEDFDSRSLARIPCALERLIYISSTRDYNSGLYHHEGLASRFTAAATAKALEHAHAEAFRVVSAMPLEHLTEELEKYMKASREDSGAFLNAWQKLEPYRVAIPMCADPTVVDVFVSNIKIALAILRHRLAKVTGHPSSALLPQSPGQQSLPQSRS
jgi:hypothetical protein